MRIAGRRESGSRERRQVVLRYVLALLPLCAAAPAAAWAQERTIPTPSQYLGIAVGADSVLADWGQIHRYFGALAGASPAVRLDTIGRTTLGKPLLLVTVTDPANQTHLEAIRTGQALLADPRGVAAERIDSLIRHAPAVVFINNNIHSTEIGSSQFSMVLAHRLATDPSYDAIRRNVVVVMTPSANPDGLDTVVAWYRANRGTRFEAGPLPWLYHPYVGHDNNRDWFMLTQVETRAISAVLYHDWFPEVVWDVHQMGSRGARLFVPPFSDPVNPNLDPAIVEAISMAGTAMAAAIYDQGKTGVAHQTRFDLWWHGGFRTVPARHNMVGILSEAASARLASPIHLDPADLRQPELGVTYPAPWPGGWWRLGDIIEYELLAADGLLRLVAAQREAFVRRFVEANRRAVARGAEEAPFAYVLPPDQRDPWAVHTVVDLLLATGIEIRRATQPFEADGTRFPAGTLVIPMAQPFRAHVKDLLERQAYPDRRRYPGGPPTAPYDVAGWTLPLQTGIDAPVIARPFTFDGERIRRASIAPGTVHGAGPQRVLANRSNMESRTLAAALAAGARAWVTREPLRAGGARLETGAVVLEQPGDTAALAALVAEHARSYGFDAWAADGLRPGGAAVIETLPRIGLYKPWTASMDEGWTRWVFERFGIPFRSVSDSTIRSGRLADEFDVLVLPDVRERSIVSGRSRSAVPARFSGGIGEDGARQVAAFVRSGGVLVTLDASSSFAMSWLNLPIRNGLASGSRADEGSRFFAPGSIFGVALEPGQPLTSGLADSTHVYFANSMAFEVDEPARVLGRYVPEPLRSGYALGQEQLAGQAALVEVPVGEGRVVMFGFRPQHRGQTHGTFKLLFNAVLLRAAP